MQPNSLVTPSKVLIVVYAYIAVFVVIGLQPESINSGLWSLWTTLNPIVAGMLATGAAVWVWRTSAPQTAKVWHLLAIGLGMWTLAELTWALLTALVGGELIYVSAADCLWITGYIFVGAAIQAQLNRSRQYLNWAAVGLALLVGVAFAAVAVIVVLQPMYEGAAMGSGLSLILTLLYPAADATLAVGSVLAIQAARGGGRWHPWWSIGFAFLLWAYADLCFSILGWIGAYGFNGLSAVAVDIPYGLAYLFVAAGCLQTVSLAQRQQASAMVAELA